MFSVFARKVSFLVIYFWIQYNIQFHTHVLPLTLLARLARSARPSCLGRPFPFSLRAFRRSSSSASWQLPTRGRPHGSIPNVFSLRARFGVVS